jgi:hypothetical protein
MAIGAVSSVTDKPGLQEVEDLFREHHELVYRTAYETIERDGGRPGPDDPLQSFTLQGA